MKMLWILVSVAGCHKHGPALRCLRQRAPCGRNNLLQKRLQRQNGSLYLTTLYYDWPGGRNLLLIRKAARGLDMGHGMDQRNLLLLQ